MLIQQHAVAAQEEAHRERQQKHGAHAAEETRLEAAGQAELAEVDLLDVAPIRHRWREAARRAPPPNK